MLHLLFGPSYLYLNGLSKYNVYKRERDLGKQKESVMYCNMSAGFNFDVFAAIRLQKDVHIAHYT